MFVAWTLGVSVLICLGRRTVTGLLTSSGQQFADWTAAYRLFEMERIDMDMDKVFLPTLQAVAQTFGDDLPFMAVLDDTTVGKRGRKIKGASWRQDPLGPVFHTNFVWSRRFPRTAAILPESGLRSKALGMALPRPKWRRLKPDERLASI